MIPLFSSPRLPRSLACLTLIALLSGCETMDTPTGTPAASLAGDWWSLPWEDASAARGDQVMLPDGSVMAAKSIKQSGSNLDALWVKAKGDVIVQTPGSKPTRARAYQATYRDGVITMEGKPVAVKATTRLIAEDGLTRITIANGELSVEGPSRLETVEKGPPPLVTPKLEAPTPAPAPASNPKPAATQSKPKAAPAKVTDAPKPAPANPTSPAPAKTEPPKPAPAPSPKPAPTPAPTPAPSPTLPKMRLPDEIDLPGLQPAPKP